MDAILEKLHFLVAKEVSKISEEITEDKVALYITGESHNEDCNTTYYEIIIIKKGVIQKKNLKTDMIHLLECAFGATTYGAMSSQEIIENYPIYAENCKFCDKTN